MLQYLIVCPLVFLAGFVDSIAEGDKVMIRFTMSGTQTQPFMGMPATGKPVRVTAMNIYELKDSKIVREHSVPDLFSMLMQLGMLPVPGSK